MRKKHIQGAIHNLRRYFLLIIFQSYLTQTRPICSRRAELPLVM